MAHKVLDISTLGFAEFAGLVGHYNHLASGKSDVDPSLASRGYSPEAIAEAKKRSETSFTPVESLGLRFTKSLSNFKSDILDYALVLFDNYERGHLPFPGSVSEQPAQIMEVFSVLGSLKAEREDKQRKKMERDVGNLRKSKSRAGR